jgi:hypothetical protein
MFAFKKRSLNSSTCKQPIRSSLANAARCRNHAVQKNDLARVFFQKEKNEQTKMARSLGKGWRGRSSLAWVELQRKVTLAPRVPLFGCAARMAVLSARRLRGSSPQWRPSCCCLNFTKPDPLSPPLFRHGARRARFSRKMRTLYSSTFKQPSSSCLSIASRCRVHPA